MFRTEKTMFRSPGDDSQAARMPRIKRVFTGDYLLDAEMGEVSLGIVFALDHGPAGGDTYADVLGAGEAWDLLLV